MEQKHDLGKEENGDHLKGSELVPVRMHESPTLGSLGLRPLDLNSQVIATPLNAVCQNDNGKEAQKEENQEMHDEADGVVDVDQNQDGETEEETEHDVEAFVEGLLIEPNPGDTANDPQLKQEFDANEPQ